MTTSYPCPRCGAAASLTDGCPGCGAAPDPDAAEVIRLDERIAELNRNLHDARGLVTALTQRLHDAHATRNQHVARVAARRGRPAPVPALSAPPAPSGTPAEARLSTLTVQNVLFALGGLLLVVAAAVFTAVAWAQVGVTGRALLLAGATAAVLAVPPFAVRRGLTAAGETLAAVGLLMILLDGYAAWAVDFLWVRLHDPSGYAAAVLTITAGIAVAYAYATKLRGPRIAALIMVQPVFPLVANALDAESTGWSLAFTATAAVDVAVLRLRSFRFAAPLAYVGALAAGILGAMLALSDVAAAATPSASAVAGATLVLPPALLLTWALLDRRPAARAIAAGLLVVAIGIAGGRWAWNLNIDVNGAGWQATRLALLALVVAAAVDLLPRSTAGFATLAPPATTPPPPAGPGSPVSGRSPGAGSPDPSATPAPPSTAPATSSTAPAPPSTAPATSSTAPATSSAAGPVGGSAGTAHRGSGLLGWVPREVGLGAWLGALLVGAAPAFAVLLASVAGAVLSVATARPVFGTPADWAVPRVELDLMVAAVVTGVAYAIMVPRRAWTDLGLTTLVSVGFLVPTSFGLPWWAASFTGVVVGAVALGFAARSRTAREAAYRVVVALAGLVHAVIVGVGNATVIAAVAGAIAVLGIGAALTVRGTPRGADVGAGAMTVGLLAVPATVWLALFAADVPVTGRVRVSLLVAGLLCLVAHGAARRLPGYGLQALGVALVVAGFAPVWAAPGTDPVVLYAAGGLLLIVSLLPLPGTRTAAGGAAAALPAMALFALTAADLAVVLLEPWTALRHIWSGIPPQQSPVAWANVAALVAAMVAASSTGWLLVRSGALAVVRTPARGHSAGTTSDSASIHSAPGEPGGGGGEDGASGEPGVAGSTGPGSAGPRAAAAGRPGLSAGLVAGWAAVPFVAVLVPLVFAAAGVAWPAVPIAGLVTGLAGLVAVALAPARHTIGGVFAVLFGALGAAGVAGSAAEHGATIAAFALVLAGGVTVGVAGRVQADRVAGWLAGSVSVVVLAYTISDLIDLGIAGPALIVLAAAALVVALEGVLAGRRPAESWAPFVVGHASALVALFLTESLGWAALVCKLWALVLTVRALRPGETRRGRFGYGVAAGSVALAGWWLLLSSRDVETTEIYTLPAAALALAAGWFARRTRPDLPSWSAYGAALAAAFLPSLAVIASSGADEPQYPRRLLLGVGALIVLLVGARARLKAPVVTGGGTLLLVALHELVQFWDLLPRWVPLAVGGLLLVGIATTMEQRRRDLARLRAAITRLA
ncbi:SCO7613 C-terminal domain-containing membrane protein [Actinoplanes subglobosus]|uniref:SCO7613 C-terminal domain-containing membrane protein n=1 Tax=Actinoplanes subglobosus TaxID=1547892 RepID=A0ABV8J5F8_9ACTN